MKHRRFTAKVRAELPHHLRSQNDLRHQNDGVFSQSQRLLYQTQVNLRLSAAGNAPQQRHRGFASQNSLQDFLISRLLFVVEQNLRPRLHLVKGRHPQIFLGGKGDQPRLLHGFQGAGGRAGIVADLCRRASARRGQKVYHFKPRRSGAALRLRQGKCILRVNGQLHHTVKFVADFTAGIGLTGQDPGLFHCFQRFFGFCSQYVPQQGAFCPSPLLFQKFQCLNCAGDSCRSGASRLLVHGGRPFLPESVPETGGENGFHCLKHGAEIPPPHPESQIDPGLIQHRLRIQHAANGFHTGGLRFYRPGQYDPFAFLVPPSERNNDPDARHRRFRQRFRHQIAVRLINGIGRGADRNLYHVCGLHATPSSSAAF